jgi:D-alanyl-D-alanine carboxypeptidase
MISVVIGVRVLVGVAAVPALAIPAALPDPPPAPSTTTTTTTTTTTPTPTTASTPSMPNTTTAAQPAATEPWSTTTTLPSALELPAASWARFDELLAGQLTGRGDRAAAVAVSVDGYLVHSAGFGTRTPDDPLDAVTTSDRFRIASISKVVTATVALQLVDAGVLQLDVPVGHRLAGLVGVAPGNGVPAVTVRQLLSHTSGLPDYRRQFFGDQFTSCEQAAAFGLARPLAHQPGAEHDYSNLNFCLLGLLIADATGRSYEAAVTELLLRPLGISGMRLVATVDPNPDEVVHVSGAQRTYMQSLGGAGAWVATPADMVRILDSLDPASPGWHPLPPELATMMRQALDVTYPEPSERRYGLGIVLWPDGSWGHTGTVENTHTMLVRRPDGVTWCILVSGDVPESTEELRELFDRALGQSRIALS